METISIGPHTIIQGDWEKIILSDKVTAVLTDPPYGIRYLKGDSGNPSRPGGSVFHSTRLITNDDRPFDPRPILSLNLETLLWGADRYRSKLPATGRFLAWDKLAGREPWDSFSDVDFAWHSVNGASRIFSMLWKGVACEKTGEDNGKRYHSAQKPVRLMEWCLKQLRDPSVVLDPYMGSGSTGVAVIRSKIGRFLGIEIDADNFKIAHTRLQREYEKLS